MSRHSFFTLSLSVLGFTACATGTTMGVDRETAPSAKVALDLTLETGAKASFPSAVEPRLPSVDRIAHHVRARLGDDATAALELCVSPAGRVTKVSMIQGSTYEPFDAAVVRDAQAWRFTTMPGPDSLQSCERVEVTYVAPR